MSDVVHQSRCFLLLPLPSSSSACIYEIQVVVHNLVILEIIPIFCVLSSCRVHPRCVRPRRSRYCSCCAYYICRVYSRCYVDPSCHASSGYRVHRVCIILIYIIVVVIIC